MNKETLHWKGFEYEHHEKNADWLWALWTISIVSAIISIILNNVLLAIILLISAFAFSLYSTKTPELNTFEINKNGVLINEILHRYSSIDSFWVEVENETKPKIILKSKKILSPYIIIPIDDIAPEEVKKYLVQYLEEEKHEEPFAHQLMERFGF